MCKSTQRTRRWRLRKALGNAAPASAALIVRQPRFDKPRKPRGRPRLAQEQLSAEGLRTRLYRESLQMRQSVLPLDALITVAAAAAEAEAEAERTRQDNLLKAMRKLDTRNASDGKVADGPRAVRLTAARAERNLECCIGGSDELCADAYPMRCCGQGMCKACLKAWLRRNGERQDVGYGSEAYYIPVDGERQIMARSSYTQGLGDGRRYTKKIWTHHCPLCRHPVESVRRGLVTG